MFEGKMLISKILIYNFYFSKILPESQYSLYNFQKACSGMASQILIQQKRIGWASNLSTQTLFKETHMK